MKITVELTDSEVAGLRHWHSVAASFDDVEHATGADLVGVLNLLAKTASDSPQPPTDAFAFTIDDDNGGTWTPWTDGYAVGYRVTTEDGRAEYIYLNPSRSDSDHNAFVYVGPEGDPNHDGAEHYYVVLRAYDSGVS